MDVVGQKLYFLVNDDLVIGLGRLNRHWSGFRYEADALFTQVAEMANLVGCIFPINSTGFTKHTGDDAALRLRGLKQWLEGDVSKSRRIEWLIGRRMISSFDSESMILIDFLEMDRSTFASEYGANQEMALFDLWEFDGVLIERDNRQPAKLPNGRMLDVFSDPDCWIEAPGRRLTAY